MALTSLFHQHNTSCLQWSFTTSHSLCFSCNQALPFFPPYKADGYIYKGTPWKTKTEIMETKISATVLPYLCLFCPSHLSYSLDFKHSLHSILKLSVHCKTSNNFNDSNNRIFKCNHCIKELENYLTLWKFPLFLPHKHLSCFFFFTIKKKNLGATEKFMPMKSIQQKKNYGKLAIFFNCTVESY